MKIIIIDYKVNRNISSQFNVTKLCRRGNTNLFSCFSLHFFFFRSFLHQKILINNLYTFHFIHPMVTGRFTTNSQQAYPYNIIQVLSVWGMSYNFNSISTYVVISYSYFQQNRFQVSAIFLCSRIVGCRVCKWWILNTKWMLGWEMFWMRCRLRISHFAREIEMKLML